MHLTQLTLLACALFYTQPLFAYSIPSEDKAALFALFGEKSAATMKLNDLQKDGHSLTLIRSQIIDNEPSGLKDTAIGNSEAFFFCNTYLETMTQVIVDGKTAQLDVYHRTPSEESLKIAATSKAASAFSPLSGLYYDWKHIVRAFNGQTITTPQEREQAKQSGIMAFQSVKVTQKSVLDFGTKKHQQIIENCNKSRGRFKDINQEKSEQARYQKVIDTLGKLGTGSGGNSSASGALH
jgi:hypothetical protein